jgi:hypothetical protein
METHATAFTIYILKSCVLLNGRWKLVNQKDGTVCAISVKVHSKFEPTPEKMDYGNTPLSRLLLKETPLSE